MKRTDPRNLTEIIRDGRAIDRAVRKATRAAVLLHKKLGFPIAIWREGRTVWVKPEDIGGNGRGKTQKPRRNGRKHARRRSGRRKAR